MDWEEEVMGMALEETAMVEGWVVVAVMGVD